MNRYLVTVIVSTYNSEEFMQECLEDLAAQSIFDKIEVVVVDAASPQKEGEIVRKFQKRYPNIRYIRCEETNGIYAAWNLAIKVASGRYIMPFSTNDRLDCNACEILSDALNKHTDISLVYGDTYLTDRPHESFIKHRRIGRYEWPDYSYKDLLQNCRIGPNPMWRKSVHNDAGYFDEKYTGLGDYEFWLRIGNRYRFLHLPVVTGLFWINSESLSMDRKESEREISEIREKYQRQYLQRLGADDNCNTDEPASEQPGLFSRRDYYIFDPAYAAADIVRLYYRGTKREVYFQKRDIAWFFDINFVNPEWLMSSLAGIYNLLSASVSEMGDISDKPLEAVKLFAKTMGRCIKKPPGGITDSKRKGSLEEVLKELFTELSQDSSDPHNYQKNILLSEYLNRYEYFGRRLYSKVKNLQTEKDLFINGIFKTLAMVTGEALGAYYLYSRSLNRLTPELERIDEILGKTISG